MLSVCMFFFFNDTATTEIYTLSLHDALPIYKPRATESGRHSSRSRRLRTSSIPKADRKSTRLNSSHDQISYAVFCLKKKKIPTSVPAAPATVHADRYLSHLVPTRYAVHLRCV